MAPAIDLKQYPAGFYPPEEIFQGFKPLTCACSVAEQRWLTYTSGKEQKSI